MAERSTGGCCSDPERATPFAQRVEVGQRRRVLLRRAMLVSCAVLCAVALLLSVVGVSTAVAYRLEWAAAVCAAVVLLGWARSAMTTGRVPWRLVVGVAAVVAGFVWHPLVPALVALAALTEHVLRPSDQQAAVPQGGSTSTVVGQPG
ncbi:hypothetical protein [Actinocrispum wychmicini]|uniref:Uncharacterized protein n=1 Tax=Actinocrispum wychmicini TaxID=1213861 RepID=A0A4R2JHH0_9PSEU|nr:hypothetical protein [Actinocrispum wychmicini]TCO59291.1 hypothetical protein EV192_104132 [Actinocrispum wychmicini]